MTDDLAALLLIALMALIVGSTAVATAYVTTQPAVCVCSEIR